MEKAPSRLRLVPRRPFRERSHDLTAAETDRLVRIALRALAAEVGAGTYEGGFRYTPGLLTGLLRRRAMAGEPHRLLVGHDPAASEAARRLRQVMTDLDRRHPAKAVRWRPQMEGLLSYFEEGSGEGDLLLRIMEMA